MGSGFRYYRPDGKPLRDSATLERIRSLAVPPAYTNVWISPIPNSHLQATGRDAKGRKQYRYHPQWRVWRDANKYHRVLAFGKALPKIRRQVQKDLKRPGLCREKVLATIVRLLEVTLIRVGNDEYARSNQSFGLTTLRDRHASVRGSKVQFRFRGKSGKAHEIELNDKKLSNIVKRCRDLPGQELFQYIDDDGSRHSIRSQDVNDYLRDITQDDFTAKDFRTWAGTVLTATALHEIETFTSQRQAQKNVLRAIESVSCLLGNTPAICRRCYVHPDIIEAYLDRTLSDKLQRSRAASDRSSHGLRQDERAVMSLLRSRR
ncbi:MAG TPA: DNA topoisomerase IB [Dongiaceae bacterium]|nr:DNA topoisomerase IB [Dongiaceae bacterium]